MVVHTFQNTAPDILVISRSRSQRQSFKQLMCDQYDVIARHPWFLVRYTYDQCYPRIVVIENACISPAIHTILGHMESSIILIMETHERSRFNALLRVHPNVNKSNLLALL